MIAHILIKMSTISEKMPKDRVKTIIKDGFIDKYNDDFFETVWKEVEDKNQGIVPLVYEIQPFIINGLETLDFEDTCRYSVNFARFVNIGGDPQYFISGSGAPGNCEIM